LCDVSYTLYMPHTDFHMYPWPRSSIGSFSASLRSLTRRALYVTDTFPGVKLIYFQCLKSARYNQWAQYYMKNLHQELEGNGHTVRPLSFRVIEHANHFVRPHSHLGRRG
jgi:hypothetical protein